MLAETATSVSGVDISADAIEYAKTNYSASNIQYYQDNATPTYFFMMILLMSLFPSRLLNI